MALTGKKTVEIEIKSSGDAFHQLFGHNPHEVPKLIPDIVQGCNLDKGEWGVDGYVVSWSYLHDDKYLVAKEIVHVNDAEKWITWDLVGGDLMELYTSLLFTAKVDKKGEDSLVTWTLDYQKANDVVPDPDSYLEFFTELTKGIEASISKSK